MEKSSNVFTNTMLGSVRTLLGEDGSIWFLSNDVTKKVIYQEEGAIS